MAILQVLLVMIITIVLTYYKKNIFIAAIFLFFSFLLFLYHLFVLNQIISHLIGTSTHTSHYRLITPSRVSFSAVDSVEPRLLPDMIHAYGLASTT